MPHFQIDALLLFLILSQKFGLKPRPYRTALLAEVKTLNLFHKDMGQHQIEGCSTIY